MKYKRILLKLSGESLMGHQGHGIDPERLGQYAAQIKEAAQMGVQIAIVIGGGNIFRGLQGAAKGFDRVHGDQMGMLATTINSLALSSALTAIDQPCEMLTATPMEAFAQYYNPRKGRQALAEGRVAIVAGGTGNPYFTTDTASALRAIELQCDVMLKGTRVDGVYTADPEKDPSAVRYEHITYGEILEKGLRVMDLTATALCQDNDMPIVVFDMDTPGNLLRLLQGAPIGTRVTNS